MRLVLQVAEWPTASLYITLDGIPSSSLFIKIILASYRCMLHYKVFIYQWCLTPRKNQPLEHCFVHEKMSIANHKVPTRSWLNFHLSSGDFPCTSNEPHPVYCYDKANWRRSKLDLYGFQISCLSSIFLSLEYQCMNSAFSITLLPSQASIQSILPFSSHADNENLATWPELLYQFHTVKCIARANIDNYLEVHWLPNFGPVLI